MAQEKGYIIHCDIENTMRQLAQSDQCSWDHENTTLMEGVMFLTLLDSSYEFYYAYHGFEATILEVQRENLSGVCTDPSKILPF